MTWQEVDALDRNIVVVIPTGSLEQHGAHLPLLTDSLIATAVTTAVEKAMPAQVLLTPCIWLGASGHHLPFAGTCSASMSGYIEAVTQIVESLKRHRFHRFVIINGHGGNNEPNGVALRALKLDNPNLTLGHAGYDQFCAHDTSLVLTGPAKSIQHACEAETSLMLHLFPDKVRTEKIRDDGLVSNPPTSCLVNMWDEISEQGVLGYATQATADKGKIIFEAAVLGIVKEIQAIHGGIVYEG
jgi:creatinine amidohydrolase